MDSGLCAVFQVDVNYRVERHFKTNKGRAVGKSIEYEMVTLIEVADDNKSVVVKDGMTKRQYFVTSSLLWYVSIQYYLLYPNSKTVDFQLGVKY